MKSKNFFKLVLVLCLAACLAVGLAACKDGGNDGSGDGSESHTYSVKFYVDGAEYKSVSVDDFYAFDFPARPSKTLYAFDDWYLEENFQIKFTLNYLQQNPDKTINVYAKWALDEAFKEGDFSFVTINDNIFVCGYDGTATEITLPATMKGLPVTGVRNDRGWPQALTKVTVPSSVKTLGLSAFAGLKNLQQVVLPEGLVGIGKSAFNSCAKLASITIPDSVQSIGDGAFADCAALASIGFGANSALKAVENHAFKSCKALTTFEFPKSVEFMGSNVFAYCENLESVMFEEGTKITDISGYAFLACKKLTSFDLPNTVTRIGGHAFRESGITNITIDVDESNLLGIGSGAFNSTALNQELVLPKKLKEVGDSAFNNCPDAKISLAQATQLETIRYNAFYGCTIVDETWEVPASLASLEGYSFGNNKGLKYLNFAPNSKLRVIDYGAFSQSQDLETVAFSPNLRTIGNHAFDHCTKLADVTFAANSQLQYIYYHAFGYAAIKEIVLPKSLQLDYGSWQTGEGIESWNSSVSHYAFYYCQQLEKVTFEEGSQAKSISSYMFYYCTKLKEVVLPDTIKLIAERAFYGCSSLTDINWPSDLERIFNYAFYDTALEKIELPSKLAHIGQYAFYYCRSLTEVKLPASLQYLGNQDNSLRMESYSNGHVFSECYQLEKVTFEDGSQLHSIYQYCFNNTAIKKIVIPLSTQRVGQYIFNTTSAQVFLEITYYPYNWNSYWNEGIRSPGGYWLGDQWHYDTVTGEPVPNG